MGTTKLSFASLQERVGQELGVSEWMPITQEQIDTFADVTGDKDWLHNDPERCAKESPFGGHTIAQGHLLLAHLTQGAEDLMPHPDDLMYALNYGYDRVRFLRPVSVDSRIRVRLTLREIASKGENQYVLKSEAAVEVEGSDAHHLVAQWLFFVQMAG